MDRVAGAAAVLGAADAQDAKLRWNPVEHLARRLADRMEGTTAARTVIALHIERHVLARQMIGKWSAPGPGPGLGFPIACRRRRLLCLRAADVRVEVFEPQGKLIGIEALGAASELPSLKLLDEALEALDLVVAGLDNGGHIAHQMVQKADIGRQVLEVESHERF